MRLLVFSDTHGSAGPMRRALSALRPDEAVFLGDGVRDAAALAAAFPGIPFRILRGNCDFDPAYPESALFDFGGVRIFAAHGHNHGVKLSMDGFLNSVYCSGARLGLYGHTHRPLWREIRGLQLLNPGSAGDPRSPTFAVVEAENGAFSCRILDINDLKDD